MKCLAYLFVAFAIVIKVNAQQVETYTDPRDWTVYKTVKIGDQVWMAENLAYKPSSGNYWIYNDDLEYYYIQDNVTKDEYLASYLAKYGYLYDWQTAKKVCPPGWHLPSKREFETLLSNFDWSGNAYIALKVGGGSGFNALFGGYCTGNNGFFVGTGGWWWSSSVYSSTTVVRAWCLEIYSGDQEAKISNVPRTSGYSVRCIQD